MAVVLLAAGCGLDGRDSIVAPISGSDSISDYAPEIRDQWEQLARYDSTEYGCLDRDAEKAFLEKTVKKFKASAKPVGNGSWGKMKWVTVDCNSKPRVINVIAHDFSAKVFDNLGNSRQFITAINGYSGWLICSVLVRLNSGQIVPRLLNTGVGSFELEPERMVGVIFYGRRFNEEKDVDEWFPLCGTLIRWVR